MNFKQLNPQPKSRERFHRSRQRFVPRKAGCYALVSFQGTVLYVGLARNLKRRFGDHLDDPKKTSNTADGRAFFFLWHECIALERIERTWQNECETVDGKLPVLNRIRSPIST